MPPRVDSTIRRMPNTVPTAAPITATRDSAVRISPMSSLPVLPARHRPSVTTCPRGAFR